MTEFDFNDEFDLMTTEHQHEMQHAADDYENITRSDVHRAEEADEDMSFAEDEAGESYLHDPFQDDVHWDLQDTDFYWNDVDQGMYDDDLSPYNGNYSEE